jgi:LacI family transcriptional regulator
VTNGRPTLASVAASAGVSVSTVSKVLNGRADVGPETRAKVEALLAQLEYVGRRTDAAARSNAQQVVELVFHGQLVAYALDVLQGVLDTAEDLGVAVVVSLRPRHPGTGRDSTTAWVRRLAAAGRTAVVDVVDDVHAGDLTALARARLPLVVIDPLNLPRAEVTSVGATNFAGGLAATEHLLSLGHRRIAYLGGVAGSTVDQARMHGYLAAMGARRVPVPEGQLRWGGFQYQGGLDEGRALLGLAEPPTAVFAASDEMAAGLLEAARSRGLQLPQDLSVVGFDDTQVARLTSPPLTTVRQPLREMGAVALRTALRLAAGDKLDSHHVELATELVVRESTAPPAGGAGAAGA